MTAAAKPALTLLLLRHAKSRWDDPNADDFDRGLASRGEEAAPKMGRWLKEQGLTPDLMVVSTAARARATARLVVAGWGEEPERVDTRDLYMASAPGVIDIAKKNGGKAQRLMLVGHNPGMEAAARALIGRGKAKLRDEMAAKFPTAACAVIGFDANAWGEIESGEGELLNFVRPKDLR